MTASGCPTANLAELNPLRYRGYYYDTETGWYYLQSRYYDPIVKRFINADSYASTGQGFLGYNMFAYCGNNPVMNNDPSGEFLITAALIVIGGGILVGGVMGGISAASEGEDVFTGVVEGGLIGGATAAIGFFAPEIGLSMGGALLISGASGAVIDTAFQAGEAIAEDKNFSWDWKRSLLAAGGGVVGTLGLSGLSPATSTLDAVSAAIVSADLSATYGCADAIVKALRRNSRTAMPVTKSVASASRVNSVEMTR